MVRDQGPKGWIGVDMDGTLFTYTEWTAWDSFGEPIPLMADRVKRWVIEERKDVRIFTARMPLPHEQEIEQTCYKTGQKFTGVMMKKAIADHCEKHLGFRLRAQCYKDLHCIEIWDDRAVGVVANTGQTLADAALSEAFAKEGRAWGDGKGRFA
jgi:hypothetical protein